MNAGSLAIGTVQTFMALDIPSALSRFHADHPGVDTHALDNSVVAVHTYEEPLTAVVSGSHTLATTDHVTLETLGEHPFVDFDAGVGLQTVVDSLFRAAGVERNITFRVSDMHRLLDLVEHGLGVAVIPLAIAARREMLTQLTIDIDPTPRRLLALASRTEVPTNPAARAFLEQIDERRP